MKQPTAVADAQAEQHFLLAVLLYFQKHQATLNKKVHHILWHRSLVAAAIVILLIAPVWIIGNLFGTRFALQNNVYSASESNAHLARLVQSQISSYKLQLIQPDGKQQSYALQDMGLQADVDHTIALARTEQHSWTSRLEWWRPIPLQLTIRADSKAFHDFVAHHATVVISPAQNATINIVNGATQLTDGKIGKQYGLHDPTAVILRAVSALSTEPLRMQESNQQPVVSAKSLATVKSQLDAIFKQAVNFTIDGQQVKPSATDIASWVTYTPGATTNNITVNSDKVRDYIDGIAADHSHPPRAQIALGSTTIPGSPGVTVTGKDAAVDTIKQKLLENHGLQITLPTERRAFKTIQATPAAKWLEVDLTNKRMYAYQQTDLVKTFLVSAGAPATPTVVGTFAIYSKYARQTMSGANADGSHYVQPNVPWINYFYRDYAIHGNYWRPNSYFGNINSSHGCVGVTPGDGAWVFNWASVGTPVVVHT
jgi:lipoprotein-anchoring transpeptidase ErfK/SrfK